jgi:hypothetical protein
LTVALVVHLHDGWTVVKARASDKRSTCSWQPDERSTPLME